jgi:hypothetical protein
MVAQTRTSLREGEKGVSEMGTETLERPVAQTADTQPTHGSRSLVVVLIAVAALLLGGLGGWLLRGDDGGTDDVIVVNGSELTERQEQMLQIGDEYFAAVRDGDGETLASLFVPEGYVTFEQINRQARVDDGSLAQIVSGGVNPGLELYEPVLVSDDTLVYTYGLAGDTTEVMKFTPTGEVQIIRSTVTW